MSNVDFIRIVEAAYRIDRDDDPWLSGILEACRDWVDAGFGIFGATFEKRPGCSVRLLESASIGPDWLSGAIRETNSEMSAFSAARLYDGSLCATASDILGPNFVCSLDRGIESAKVADATGFIARDTTDSGCIFVALSPKPVKITPSLLHVWEQIAAHIAASLRIRRFVQATCAELASNVDLGVEAVISPGGQIEHAAGPACAPEARLRLAASAKAMTLARGHLRGPEPLRALQLWQPLVDARWTLLDGFELAGQRYILARENAQPGRGPAVLTARERQVAGLIAQGHYAKLVAYELGIAHSTVRVLLGRAMKKLSIRSRADLRRALDSGECARADPMANG